MAKRLRPWHITALALVIYLGAIFFLNGADPAAFAYIGTRFSEADPQGTEGYDGQFVYYIAMDPTNAAEKLDVPAYRYQRILLPAAARLIGLGQPALISWALVLTNATALVTGVAILERLLERQEVSRWYALTYGLFGGSLLAVRLDLTEPLAYGLALAGIWLAQEDRRIGAAVAFGLAALSKETALFFPAGYVLYDFLAGRYRAGVIMGAISAAPFAAWQIVLKTTLGAFGIGSGGAMATGFEIVPFMGILRIAEGGAQIFAVFLLMLVPMVVLPSLWGIGRALRDARAGYHHPYVYVLLANALVMPFVPFSTYREPLGILRMINGLVIAVILYAALRKLMRPLNYSLFWMATSAFVVWG